MQPDTLPLSFRYISSLKDVSASAWNQLRQDNNPFTRHEFLAALENSGSVGADTGWQPHHLLGYCDNRLVVAMPLYLKHHSYGEYVFDWSWADAYHQHQLEYYPKLLSAIPFTPSTGPRVLHSHEWQLADLAPLIHLQLDQTSQQQGYSSWHLLFPDSATHAAFDLPGLSQRMGCQYHWQNRKYRDFEDFLDHFASRKRKAVRKERRQVADKAIQLKWLEGTHITPDVMDQFYLFYQATYYKRGRQGYLNADFFQQLLQDMPEQLLLIQASKESRVIAGALCLRSDTHLYGRYWGSFEDYPCLHFETCYYQGIEYCIERGLQYFDPGAQGEHKISRGFEPTATWSVHSIQHPAFRQAVDRFVRQEKAGMKAYMEDAFDALPFKKA